MSGKLEYRHNYAPIGLASVMIALFASLQNGSAGQLAANRTAESVRLEQTPQVHLGAAYEALRADRCDIAAREFRAALALNPKLALQARFPLAAALFQCHRWQEARHEFETVRSETGDHPNIGYYLGRIDMAEGKLDSAVMELQKAAANPPFPDTAYHLGSAYLSRHELAQAERWLRRAAQLQPHDPAVQQRLGLLYSEAGRKADAQAAFSRAEQLRQNQAEMDQIKVECARRLAHDSLVNARPVCERLAETGEVERLTTLGTVYGQAGYYSEALMPLRRAAQLSPNSPQMQYNLALDCFRLKRYAEARQLLISAVRAWPDLYPLNALLGGVLYRLGDERAAYTAFHRAYELYPSDAETAAKLYELALSLAQKELADQRYSGALQYFKEASRIRPQAMEPHQRMSEIYEKAGRRTEATREEQLARRLSPSQ